MFYFSIPDSSANRPVNKVLLFGIIQHPDWVYDDFKISSVYGSLSNCIWNGNRPTDGPTEFPQYWVDSVVRMYNFFGLEYRATLTNFCLEPVHLYDTYANAFVKALNQVNDNSAMVSTDMMWKYLSDNYPHLKLCWSTTTDFGKSIEEQIHKINELSEKNLVVLPYEFNNTDYLQQFLHPENLEVLINEKCIDHCPYRREHWKTFNEVNLFLRPEEYKICECKYNLDDPNVERHHLIPRKDLQRYVDMGISHFKIEGRCNVEATVEAYTKYIIRPEHLEEFRDYGDWLESIDFDEEKMMSGMPTHGEN